MKFFGLEINLKPPPMPEIPIEFKERLKMIVEKMEKCAELSKQGQEAMLKATDAMGERKYIQAIHHTNMASKIAMQMVTMEGELSGVRYSLMAETAKIYKDFCLEQQTGRSGYADDLEK